MGAEFWMGVADAADGVADASRDGLAGTLGGGAERPGAAVRPCRAVKLGQELFPFIAGTLVVGEVGPGLGGVELAVELGQALPVRDQCRAIKDGLG